MWARYDLRLICMRRFCVKHILKEGNGDAKYGHMVQLTFSFTWGRRRKRRRRRRLKPKPKTSSDLLNMQAAKVKRLCFPHLQSTHKLCYRSRLDGSCMAANQAGFTQTQRATCSTRACSKGEALASLLVGIFF
eukprot:1162130-Pelagomonas_calceolata.AAC.4